MGGLTPPTPGTEEPRHGWAHAAHPGRRGAAPTARLMQPTPGRGELHHGWAHSAHPRQRGAAPTAGLTLPTPGRAEPRPRLGSYRQGSLL